MDLGRTPRQSRSYSEHFRPFLLLLLREFSVLTVSTDCDLILKDPHQRTSTILKTFVDHFCAPIKEAHVCTMPVEIDFGTVPQKIMCFTGCC